MNRDLTILFLMAAMALSQAQEPPGMFEGATYSVLSPIRTPLPNGCQRVQFAALDFTNCPHLMPSTRTVRAVWDQSTVLYDVIWQGSDDCVHWSNLFTNRFSRSGQPVTIPATNRFRFYRPAI